MTKLLVGLSIALLVGCSSVRVEYTKDGITERMQLDSEGSHTIVMENNRVTITSN